ncbi:MULTISPECIES: extracellular solute-binding protein [unclassified Beijerinckia]|uniref:ABC transporter substrate-binding protein n=1 Tax=unclassified Beijerinckia TaxID=2638183 RepID=UPI000895A86A|nr:MULTISPECIES: extracellular solute-binding protein [unclassified Beijerinckia]MDH7795177.1 iron(III) transport system substrate-binding protein [Beijerinckia sp. GAS462]SEB90714.1 iron(III) transport system substrate-binding protein [Beijerinckia sp. 28-YEA-48]
MIDRRALLTAGAATSLLRYTPASAQPADWAQIERAAKAEREVVVYNTGVGLHRDVAGAFEARTGIKVNFLDMHASELRERVRIEQSAGRFVTDICLNGSTGSIVMDQLGQFQPHGGLPNEANLLDAFRDNGTRISIFQNIFGFMINTRLVPLSEEPKSFADLLHPRFKGKILADDPRASGEGYATFAVTYDKLGVGFQQQLAKQELVFTRNLLEGAQRVARGEYAVYFPQKFSDYLLLKPLPVKFIWPTEGSPYQTFMLAMARNAPHPNAARLLMNFFLDPAGQAFYARSGRGVTVRGALDDVPAEIRDALSAKLLGTADAAREAEFLKLAKDIYGA